MCMDKGMYAEDAELYDKIYSWKDYKQEVQEISDILKEYGYTKGKLLDIGCGTAKHLQYFSDSFTKEGLDLSKQLIEVARKNNPELSFYVDDMTQFDTGKTYDVIVSLFSSIGYVQTQEKLQKTFERVYAHLDQKGIAIIEPWIAPKDFSARTSLNTYEDENTKLARMINSKQQGKLSVLEIDWLISVNKEKTRHLYEEHKMGLFSKEETMRAASNAGLHIDFYEGFGRGLYILKHK